MAVADLGGVDDHLTSVSNVAIMRLDLGGAVASWNSGCERSTGRPRHDALGESWVDLLADPHEPARLAAILAEARDAGAWEGRLDTRRRDGSVASMRAHVSLMREEDGRPLGLQVVCVDISDQLRAERRLWSVEGHLRSITDNMVEGLLTFDAEGRLTSLNAAAERMLGYRYERLAGRSAHDVIHPARHGLPHSFAACPMARCDLHTVRVDDDAFVRADGTPLPVAYTAAPYTDEDGMRGSAVVFRDISDRKDAEARLAGQLDALRWVGRIRSALDDDRFELHAQPIVELATGRVAQHELLLRMRDLDGSCIAPGLFLPAAEEHGLILDIDRWVVRRALRYAARGNCVELNLSAHSIASCATLQEFAHELAATGADPSLVVIELTETALLADLEAAERFISTVKGLGCRVALDDFGTGYGGFTYLKRLPVDYLKIDTEFVSDLVANEASRHVVQAVVNLARGFGQQTVAEGAEDEETLQLLAAFGVDYAQGFVIRRPAPADELLIG